MWFCLRAANFLEPTDPKMWEGDYCISADILCVMIYAYFLSQESQTDIYFGYWEYYTKGVYT